jgi:hypothetical protein
MGMTGISRSQSQVSSVCLGIDEWGKDLLERPLEGN